MYCVSDWVREGAMPERGALAAMVKHGVIGADWVDLTVLPSSGRLKTANEEPARTQRDIEYFRIPAPNDLESPTFPRNQIGFVSALLSPQNNQERSRFVSYATTSLGGSDLLALTSIGERLGMLSMTNLEIKLIELPFLGAGKGGVPTIDAVAAMVSGFQKTRHPQAVLRFRNDNDQLVASVSEFLTDYLSGAIGKIFISYRRSDSKAEAAHLHRALQSVVGEQNVFLDVGIEAGSDFPTVIERRLSDCRLVLALIGSDWLSTRERWLLFFSRRRISNPRDWVHLELATALRLGVQIIPLLIDDATMPNEQKLPHPLKRLARLQAQPLRNRQFAVDFGLLRGAIRDSMRRSAATPTQAPRPGQNIALTP